MKKFILISVLFAQLALFSCDQLLDVDPKSEVASETLFETEEGAQDALMGVYAKLADDALYGNQLSYRYLDVLAGYYKGGTVLDNDLATINYDTEKFRKFAYGIWKKSYEVIGYLNNAIESMEGQAYDSEIYTGEALGMRALLHFDLLRLFSQQQIEGSIPDGIPYVNAYTFRIQPFLNVSEVYDAIILDLERSIQLLLPTKNLMPDERDGMITDYFSTREIHFNFYAANALLARVYWMKGDLPNAKKYALTVVNSNKFQLSNPEMLEIKNLIKGTLSFKESIWGLYNSKKPAKLYTEFRTTSDKPIPGYYTYLDYGSSAYSIVDLRYHNWFDWPVYPDLFTKLAPENPEDNSRMELPGISMIRIPEMYYILAEADLTEDPALALDYFNTVITSRGLTAVTAVTLDDVIAERRKEFVGEGQEWFSLKKYNTTFAPNWLHPYYRNNPLYINTGTPELFTFPVPTQELEERY